MKLFQTKIPKNLEDFDGTKCLEFAINCTLPITGDLYLYDCLKKDGEIHNTGKSNSFDKIFFASMIIPKVAVYAGFAYYLLR